MTASSLSSNDATSGGAIAGKMADITLQNTSVDNNRAKYGAAIAIAGIRSGSTFDTTSFGGICSINATSITNNTASRRGGGLYLGGSPDVRLTGSTFFDGNKAQEGPDVWALPLIKGALPVLRMPDGGSNLHPDSPTVLWPKKCEVDGQPLVRSQGRCAELGSTFTFSAVLENSTNEFKCSACPTVAQCRGGLILVAEEGFWHTHGQSGSVPQCTFDQVIRWVEGFGCTINPGTEL